MAIVTGTEFSGLLAVADPIRAESRDVLKQLKEYRDPSYSHADRRSSGNG